MDKLLYLLRCSRQALQVWRDLAPDKVHAGLPEERVPVGDADGRALDLGQGVHVEVALGVAAVDADACMRVHRVVRSLQSLIPKSGLKNPQI